MSPFAAKVFVIAAFVVLVGIDIALAVDGRKGNTYSEVLRGWFKRWTWLYYSVAFALGVLMSHWGAK